MAPKTAAELALAEKYELLRQKKAAAQAQQQQEEGGSKKAGPASASQPVRDGSSKSAPAAAPAKQSKHTPITFTRKMPSAESSKPLTPHEKALQALKAAREGGAARAGIGRLPQKRAPANIAPRPVLGQQRLEGSSAPSSHPPAADSSAARLDRSVKSARHEPSRKRPAQQPASPPRQAAESPQQKRHRTEAPAETFSREEEPTVFVGDLPEGCGAYELQQLFSELAHVVNISMIERKGIAFITVESEAEIGHIIDVADSAGLHIHGQMIRVARAHKPSDGPRGAVGLPEVPGVEPLKVQEARMAARALAEQVDVSQMPGIDLAPPPERGLVCYDDL